MVEAPDAGVSRNSVPVPVRVIDCGLLAALSVISILVWLVPEEDGAHETLMAQFAPAATELPQLFVCV